VAVLSYYLFFVSVVGYSYDRFFLPVCALLSVYGGKAIDHAFMYRAARPVVSGAFLLILLYNIAYSASVDALMVADSRYEVSRWMRTNVPAGSTISGVGFDTYLPPLRSYATRPLGTGPSLQLLARLSPEYIVTSSYFGPERFVEGSAGHEFFEELSSGTSNYRLALEYQGTPVFNLLAFEGVDTNLKAINPTIRIFRREAERSRDSSLLQAGGP
jgi:hypothetical protein